MNEALLMNNTAPCEPKSKQSRIVRAQSNGPATCGTSTGLIRLMKAVLNHSAEDQYLLVGIIR